MVPKSKDIREYTSLLYWTSQQLQKGKEKMCKDWEEIHKSVILRNESLYKFITYKLLVLMSEFSKSLDRVSI